MPWIRMILLLGVSFTCLQDKHELAEVPIKVLLIDGQNNHDWKSTTPFLVSILEETARFRVDVTTTPSGNDFLEWAPEFSRYDVIISNYNGHLWPKPIQDSFEKFVSGGGCVVIVHAADNAFPTWEAYNEIIGLGGWGGRNTDSGPYVRLREGAFVQVMEPGPGGSHGQRHEFVIETHDEEHPITQGIPLKWKHTIDELYDRLRGPAKNLTVLASAYSDPETRGTGENEPILMTVRYGEGRVFHTVLGHDIAGMECVGFQTTLARGSEWAATGFVTIPVPGDFPQEDSTKTRIPKVDDGDER